MAKPPREYPTYSAAAAMSWLVICLIATTWVFFTSADWAAATSGFTWLTPALAAGFAAQILFGALSYLLPVVLGGRAGGEPGVQPPRRVPRDHHQPRPGRVPAPGSQLGPSPLLGTRGSGAGPVPALPVPGAAGLPPGEGEPARCEEAEAADEGG